MDAHKMGRFIAQQRGELGMTQAELAGKLHVTDKAVSRWERGVGFPDIHLLEPLAQALGVSLVELVQAQKAAEDAISMQEANNLVSDTIQFSDNGTVSQSIGAAILGLFGIIMLFLFQVLFANGSIVAYSVGSLVLGLVAWAAPIWQMTLARNSKPAIPGIISGSSALISLAIQFFYLAHKVNVGDFAAIEDTIRALCMVVVLFCATTLLLNFLMFCRSSKHKRRNSAAL